MRKFGLIGYPLGHSFSRKYFEEKFLRENIRDCSYENFPLQNIDALPQLLSDEHDLIGFNVTIPYKTEILKYLDSISDEAGDVGAVNVVRVTRNGRAWSLSGFNSDVYGFTNSLIPHLNSNIKTAAVLGTGGSSKAVLFSLDKLGIKFVLISREKKPGTMTYEEIDREFMRSTNLFVNTTPLGMYPNIDGMPTINYDLLQPGQILYDLVYNPELTKFLKEGKERGCTIISGLAMLHLQAERSWEIWNTEN